MHDNGSVGDVSRTSPTPECKVNGTECHIWQLNGSDLFIFIYHTINTFCNLNLITANVTSHGQRYISCIYMYIHGQHLAVCQHALLRITFCNLTLIT